MKSRLEQFADYAEKYGFPENMAIFAIWNAWQEELARREMQPPETAPHDRRIIVYLDTGIEYIAEWIGASYGNWKVTSGLCLWEISGWKEIP